MIARATIFAFFVLALFTGGTLFHMLFPLAENKANGVAILEIEKMPTQNEKKTRNQQVRKGVSKDLWLSRADGDGLHHYIESPVSILNTFYLENHIELVEEMTEMRCYFQEKIEKKEGNFIQSIRYIHSEKGIYRYTNHFFNAPNVFLALYRMPGKALLTNLSIEDSYLQGMAEEVTLSLLHGSPHFQAKKFKGHLRPQTRL